MNSYTRARLRAVRSASGGQSAAEYLVVLALLSFALVVGPDSVLEQLFRAFFDQYARFTYSMSRP